MGLSLYDIKRIINPKKNLESTDDFRMIDSWTIFDEKSNKSVNERPLEYLCYELETINPDTGEKYHFYKALKFCRVIRLPKAAKQSTSFMDMHSQVLSAVYQSGINLVTIIANIFEPVPLGLLYLYGVQGIGHTIEEAQEQAKQGYLGFIAAMQGTYRVLEMRTVNAQETEWLREKMYNMDYMTVVRGIPKANQGGEDAGNKGMGGKNLNPDSQGTLEEIITGMADYEYVIQILSTPVFQHTLRRWSRRTQKDMTDWYGQLQGTKSFSMNLSMPMMFMANQTSSQGWNKAYTDAESVNFSTGESFNTSYGENVGQALSNTFSNSYTQSRGLTVTDSVTQSHGVSQGTSVGHTVGTTVGRSFGETIGENIGTSVGRNLGFNIGENFGRNVGTSENFGASQNVGQSVGQSVTEGFSQSLGKSSGISLSESINTGQSLTQSQGQSLSQSIGQSMGSSYNVSQGQNQSFSHSLGQNQGFSVNSSENWGTSQNATVGQTSGTTVGQGVNASHGTSFNSSASQGGSHSASTSYGENRGWSESSSSSWNEGKSSGGSITPFGLGGNWGNSTSLGGGSTSGQSGGTSYSESSSDASNWSNSQSSGITDSYGSSFNQSSSLSNSSSISSGSTHSTGLSQGQSWGASENFGSTVGKSMSEGWGVNQSVNQSQSISQNVGQSYGQSIGHGLSQGQTYSESVNQGQSMSFGQTMGANVSQGINHSVGTSQGFSQGMSSGQSIGASESVSHGHSYSQNQSTSISKSVSDSVTNSISESFSVSQGKSVGKSQSDSIGQSVSQGETQSFGKSTSLGQGQSFSEGRGSSQSVSQGTSGTIANGISSSMGLGPSIGYNKSYQWMDQQVKDILELLEFSNERIKKALRGEGAFYTYVYIACPSQDALSAAMTAAKATWQNEYAMINPVQVLNLSQEEQKRLLYHFAAFSSDISREVVYGVEEYKYATVLLPGEFVAYTHLPRISEGGVFAEVNDVPKFSVPSMLKGEIYMGTILSAERYTMNNGYRTPYNYCIDEAELMHGFFTGASRSGKTVAAMRFVAELAQIRRKKTGKRMRIVCMDPKQDWRTLARFVEPERFNFYSLGNTSFRPIKINPLKIPRGVEPQFWIDGLIDIYCRAYGLLERGKQMMGETIYALYEEAGVFDARKEANWKDLCSERSSEVTFSAVYKRMSQIKAALEDPHNPKGRAGNDTRDAYARLLDRLQAFNREFSIEHRLFGTSEGIGIDELIGNDDVTVLESKGLENTFRNFLFGIITSGFYKYAIAHEGGYLSEDQYETLLVIEEANEVLTGNDAAGTGGGSGAGMTVAGQSEFEQILDQSAGYGLFIMAITQKIADMPASIIANSGLVFAGKLKRPEDVTVVVRSIAREDRYEDRDLVKWFPRSPIGWFVCQSSRGYDFKDAEPILVQISQLNIAPPSNQEIDELLRHKEVLKKLSN